MFCCLCVGVIISGVLLLCDFCCCLSLDCDVLLFVVVIIFGGALLFVAN